MVENNAYGLSTPTEQALPVEDIADAAAGYGMPGEVIDGNDVLAVVDAVRRAATQARAGDGPTLLEMKTFRRRGHEEASGTKYVPQELMDAWAAQDPVDRFAKRLEEEGIRTAEALTALRAELAQLVVEASEFALAQPEVSSTAKAEQRAVFAPSPASKPTAIRAQPTRTLRYIDAVSEGLRQAMEEDPTVLLMGQDIAEYGGVFKVTQGFLEDFGAQRVRNTPIIESGAVGAAIGLALEGLRPVVEMQYADFIAYAFCQIVNNLATTHYRWGAPLNVTIRAPYGGNIGAGPFHSQCKEAWFCHVPGLKVVAPATPADAKGLLLSAIADPNPVLYFEHKHLYRSLRGSVPEAPVPVPIGAAHIARPGTDATVVTYGLGVHWALAEAERLHNEEGVEVEIVDLRTLVPLDVNAVLRSVEKTNRCLVFHEATYTCGFGAEVAAVVGERGFTFLDAPCMRVAAEDLPVPFARTLEKDVFSAQPKLRPALRELLNY